MFKPLVLLILVGSAPLVQAISDPLPDYYECRVVSVVQVNANGKLGPNNWTKLLKENFGNLLFNQASGEFRWKGNDHTDQFDVMQVGSQSNSMNAIQAYRGPASYVHRFLVIETFVDGWPFYFDDDGTIYSGTCVAG